MTARPHRFPGGLKLPAHTEGVAQRPIATLPAPSKVLLPLQQHIGEPAEPVVGVGERVLRGQLLARPSGYVSAAVHAPISGTVTELGEYPVPHPSGLRAPCLVIEGDGRDEPYPFRAHPDPLALSPEELREIVRSSGIVGLGGAAFPTSVKLNPGPDRPIRTLIANAAECEPYIACDDALLRERPDEVLRGIRILLRVLGAGECIVGVEDNKPQAHRALLGALEREPSEEVRIELVPSVYPSGGERQLIQILTGKEVPSDGLPADIGILCQNVATAAAVYRGVVLGEPLISRIVTVTGPGVSQPQNLEVRIGTPIAELLRACGGYRGEVRRLLMGGPMMGIALHSDQVPTIKATNCILALDAPSLARSQPAMPCIRCGACAEVCPVSLLPQELYWHARTRDMDRVQDYQLFDCIECGCCAYVCPSHIPLVQYYRFAKTSIWAQEREREKANLARRRHAEREERIARTKSEQEQTRRRKRAELETESPDQDPRKAAIEAAVARARARRAGQGYPTSEAEAGPSRDPPAS